MEVVVVSAHGSVRQYVVEMDRMKRMRHEWRVKVGEGQGVVKTEVCVSAVEERIQVTVFYVTREEGRLKGHPRGTVYKLHCL